MPVYLGTAAGNKEISALALGGSGGNKEISSVWLGTAAGNKEVFTLDTWDGVAYSGTKTITATMHQQASDSKYATATPVDALAASGKWRTVTLAGYLQLRRQSSSYQAAAGDVSGTAVVRVYINGESSPRVTKTVSDSWSRPSGSGKDSRSKVSLAGSFDLDNGDLVAVESVTVTMRVTITSGVANANIYVYADEVLSGVTFGK